MNDVYSSFQPTLTKLGLAKLGLSLEQVPASDRLKNIVYSYLQITATRPTPYPIIPDGTQAIFISPEGASLGAPHSLMFDIRLLHSGQYFGIRFHPGSIKNFFNVDISECKDQLIDVRDIVPPTFHFLSEQIFQSVNFHERAAICEEWLLKLIKPKLPDKFNAALLKIYQSKGNDKVGILSADVGCSSRHLNRLFHMHTGFSVKSFMQTIRLQYACQQLFLLKKTSSDLALSLGYFDQAHLLNDFKKHFFANPSDFFELFRSDFYNHKNV